MHIAPGPLAPPTEQDKEGGENEHERDVDGTGQQVMPDRQNCDEPEDDAGRQEQPNEPSARDDAGRVVLPGAATTEETK